MRGKLKDARTYFRVRSSWPSIIYVARGKARSAKTVKAGAGRRSLR